MKHTQLDIADPEKAVRLANQLEQFDYMLQDYISQIGVDRVCQAFANTIAHYDEDLSEALSDVISPPD